MPNDDTDLGIDSAIKLNPLPTNWPSMSKGQIAKARIPTEVEFDCALPQGLVNLWSSHTASDGDALLRRCVVIYPPEDFIGQVLDLVTGRIVDTKPVYASDEPRHANLLSPQPLRSARRQSSDESVGVNLSEYAK
jgi:hypothetical protein